LRRRSIMKVSSRQPATQGPRKFLAGCVLLSILALCSCHLDTSENGQTVEEEGMTEPAELGPHGTDPGGNAAVKLPAENLALPIHTFAPPWKKGPFKILRGYGTDPVNYQTHFGMDYYALDFDMTTGTSVYPTAPGKVMFAGTASGGWSCLGKIVFIDHQNGYQSLYAHLATTSVTTGQNNLSRTTKIGTSGSSTGAGCDPIPQHLHFAVYTGAVMSAGNQGPRCNGATSDQCAVKPEPMYACLKGTSGGYCENLLNNDEVYRAFFKYDQAASHYVGEACNSSSTVGTNWRWSVGGLPPNSSVRPVRLTRGAGWIWQHVGDWGCYSPYYWKLARSLDSSNSTSYKWLIYVAQYPVGDPNSSDAFRLQLINGSGDVTMVDWE
jgi:murein DD-endopeptidase MepM/ murein hydrolase activator NlpD